MNEFGDRDREPIDEPRSIPPDDANPDPAPEHERPTAAEATTSEGVDRGGTGEPVGTDNIRKGRVDGVMGGPHQSQGQGQGG
ncbi:MAG TPA: hypothetical protein VKA85_09960 [Candidatus Limnocylindrales bacterium]|nr:hypothetical protein [Candidatus Limnocylindrales bacterium]